MLRDRINNDYFEWLSDIVCGERFAKTISFRRLLMRLHAIDFRYTIPDDRNRGENGIDLRYRFACDYRGIEHADDYLDGPCSVLEMLVALSIHCEEDLMDDPLMGNRTGQWFWGMIVNLGLGSMTDDRFERRYIEDTVNRFLDRDYKPNGEGGLFTLRKCKYDLRTVEIWTQMLWYINEIGGYGRDEA